MSDCFKFGKKIGLEIGIEALKDCLRQMKAILNDNLPLWENLPREQRHLPIYGGAMNRKPAKSPTGPIRAHLHALSQSMGQDYQRVLGRYAIDRFLYRLSSSTYCDRFAIKGAMLFALWTGDTDRPTKDFDLLGLGSLAILEENFPPLPVFHSR